MPEYINTTNPYKQHHMIGQNFFERTTITATDYEKNLFNENFHGKQQVSDVTENIDTAIAETCEMMHEEMQRYQEENERNGEQKLVVPKFKLRVPKEFQKSVDAAITSSEESENEDESNTDEEEAEQEPEENKKNDLEEEHQEHQEPTNLTQHSTEEITQEEQEKEQQQHQQEQHNEEKESESLNSLLEEQEPKDEISSKSYLPEVVPAAEDLDQENSQAVIAPNLPDGNAIETVNMPINGPSEEWTPTPPVSPSITGQEATNLTTNEETINKENLTETIDLAKEDEEVQRNNDDTENSINVKDSVDISLLSGQLNTDENDAPAVSQGVPPELPLVPEETAITSAEIVNAINSPKIDVEDANDDALAIAIKLDNKLEYYNDAVEFIRILLSYSYPLCLYCNHARRIAVNALYLLLHMIEQHRFTATIGISTPTSPLSTSNTEELKSIIIKEKLKSFLPHMEAEIRYMNGMNYNKRIKKLNDNIDNDMKDMENYIKNPNDINERIYECFMCRFVTQTHKELYLHNRKMHLRSAVLCFMCRGHFQNFSEVLCHMCPGAQHKIAPLDIKFRCCLCNVDEIPSSFRLMIHLRKIHYSCDVCLENCYDQFRLSSHVWKHKQRHMCYRCGIAYRNKLDIQKHLFWKHGTESTVCKYCMQKRWRHVYHFCIPPAQFVCTICNMCFSKAVYLMVHQREHEGNLPYACSITSCEEKFVARRLLLKHTNSAHDGDVTQIEEQTMRETQADDKELEQIKVEETATNTKEEMAGQQDEQLKQVIGEEEEHVEKGKNIEEGVSATVTDEVVEKDADNKTKEETVEVNEQAETKNDEVIEPATKEVEILNSNEEKSSEKNSELEKAENIIEKVENLKEPEDGKVDQKKKKKKKRRKHALDFLNLCAPNLSESDSSSDSNSSGNEDDDDHNNDNVNANDNDDNKSNKIEIQTTNIDEKSLEPEEGVEMKTVDVPNTQNAEKTLEMWKHLLEAQGTPLDENNANRMDIALEYTDENCPNPQMMHVAIGDHDYCSMVLPPDQRKKNKKPKDKEEKKETATGNVDIADTADNGNGYGNSPMKHDYSPMKHDNSPMKQRLSSRMSDISISSSSDSSSSSSSHTCGTDCSCSGSSDSSTSNSDSSDSDSSNNSTHSASNSKKKLLSKNKESSKSPHKKLSKHSKHHKNNNNNNNKEEPMDIEEPPPEPEPEQPALPLFIESDLATDQSDSGEDYYDQHPQKVASEFLAQQRAQVMAQTQAVPNLPYNANENDTTTVIATIVAPSLNELTSPTEKTKKKLKRKKRDKRSNNNSSNSNNNNSTRQQQQQHTVIDNVTPNLSSTYNNINSDVQTENVSYYNTPYNNHNATEQFAIPMEQNPSHHVHVPIDSHNNAHNNYAHLSMEPAAAYKLFSDGGGSSSEADISLKRSKRQRRPNKFYGYTSDDESMSCSLGQSLIIGTRTFKPQPPPQLTWNKDDLPTPSKSILNNSNNKTNRTTHSFTVKHSTARSNLDGAFSEFADLIAQEGHKRTFGIAAGGKVGSGAFYKRAAKKANKSRKVSSAEEENTIFPPIPRLKIKPSKLGLNVSKLQPLREEPSEIMQKSIVDVEENDNTSSSLSSSDDESTVPVKAPKKTAQVCNTTSTTNSLPVGPTLSANALLLPQQLPAAPVPKAMAFNRKIPPALLPNPDFNTLQYFKAHNIRYPIRPPAGARQAREGESVYCYCRCPYDEVSEMIACDGEDCMIEWFHFECVGIMMAPQGKWYCAECRCELMAAKPLLPQSGGV